MENERRKRIEEKIRQAGYRNDSEFQIALAKENDTSRNPYIFDSDSLVAFLDGGRTFLPFCAPTDAGHFEGYRLMPDCSLPS